MKYLLEEEKKKQYNSDDLFKKKIKPKEELALAEVEIEEWYKKLFSCLKKIIKK